MTFFSRYFLCSSIRWSKVKAAGNFVWGILFTFSLWIEIKKEMCDCHLFIFFKKPLKIILVSSLELWKSNSYGESQVLSYAYRFEKEKLRFHGGRGGERDNEWISTIYAVTAASMTFPLHYFVKTSILNLVLLIPDVSIVQCKYLSIARPWWCSQWHFHFIALSKGRKRGEGRWADADGEGGEQAASTSQELSFCLALEFVTCE